MNFQIDCLEDWYSIKIIKWFSLKCFSPAAGSSSWNLGNCSKMNGRNTVVACWFLLLLCKMKLDVASITCDGESDTHKPKNTPQQNEQNMYFYLNGKSFCHSEITCEETFTRRKGVTINWWCMSEWARLGTSKIFIVPTV